MNRKPKPLCDRLVSARDLLYEQRRSLYDSHKCRAPGPQYGKVSEAIERELVRYDEAGGVINEAIKALEVRATAKRRVPKP